jgi:hypothetical protein
MAGHKQLRSMEIEVAENGGHTITHRFKAKPVMRRGSMGGGMGMDHPEPEQHVFGPADGGKVMEHIKKNLGLGGAAVTPPVAPNPQGQEEEEQE